MSNPGSAFYRTDLALNATYVEFVLHLLRDGGERRWFTSGVGTWDLWGWLSPHRQPTRGEGEAK